MVIDYVWADEAIAKKSAMHIEDPDGEWIRYEDIEKYIENAESVTISDMEGKAARVRNVLDSLMGDAKKLYLLKSKLSE